jgi:hypothetical protein
VLHFLIELGIPKEHISRKSGLNLVRGVISMAKKEPKELEKIELSKQPSPAGEMKKSALKAQPKKRQISKEKAEAPVNQEKREKGIKKEYAEGNTFCRITFMMPKDAAGEAKRVALLGDFNEWDKDAMPMKRLRNGNFEISLELPSNREYRFRYLIDDRRWENDRCADKYERNPYGCDDSVVIV